MRAVNAGGTSPASNPVTLSFPSTCLGVPQPPVSFDVYKTGNVLTLLWDAPDLGSAPTGYLVTVGGAVAAAVPLTGRTISAPVPPGSYVFDVRGTHFCGAGVPTPPIAITVP